jgi:O-antigen/teichoic acid export membrane protein
VARNAFHLVLGQVATTAIAIVLSAALGRSLGAVDFGVYYLVLSMSTFAYVFVEWGQSLFVIREMARQPGRAGDFLGTALAMRVAGAALVAAPTGLAAWALGYDARTCWLAVALVATSLPFFLAQGYGMVFRSRDRMGLDAQVSVANKALALVVVLGALALGTGIPGVLVAQGLAGAGALLLAARSYRRLDAGQLRRSREAAREILVGGLPILFMMVAVSVQPYLDAIILSKLAPADAVGWYGAAKNIMGTLVAPSMILAAAIYPRLSRVAGDIPVFRAEMRSALRPMLWLGALGAVGTYLFADVAIGLVFGSRGFGPAATILQAFGPALFLVFVDVLFGHVITAVGRATGFAVAKVLSVVVSTGLSLWLVPHFQERLGNGGVGLVVAFAASELVVFAGCLLVMPRGSLDPGVALDVGRALAAAAATVALFRVLPGLHPVLGIPLCVAAYGAASMALGLMSRRDLGLLKVLLRRER